MEDVFVRLTPDTVASCTVPTNSISYSVAVMSESKVNAILNSIAQDVASAKALTVSMTTESGDDHTTNVASESNAAGAGGCVGAGGIESIESSTLAADFISAVAATLDVVDPHAPWSCALCTMMNSVDDDMCCMCMAPRATSVAATADAGAAVSATGAGWWCSVCTFINALSERRFV